MRCAAVAISQRGCCSVWHWWLRGSGAVEVVHTGQRCIRLVIGGTQQAGHMSSASFGHCCLRGTSAAAANIGCLAQTSSSLQQGAYWNAGLLRSPRMWHDACCAQLAGQPSSGWLGFTAAGSSRHDGPGRAALQIVMQSGGWGARARCPVGVMAALQVGGGGYLPSGDEDR
jgi:hypothetical protein